MKSSSSILFLATVVCLMLFESLEAFQHTIKIDSNNRPSSLASARAIMTMITKGSHVQKSRRKATFILSNQSDENEDDGSLNQGDTPIDMANTKSSELKKKEQLAQITGTIFDIFSYTIQFLGALFTFGLVLNLLGYGYKFDFDHGLEINKLENIRNEIQFEREIIREEREDYLKANRNDGAVNEEVVFGNWGKSVLGK